MQQKLYTARFRPLAVTAPDCIGESKVAGQFVEYGGVPVCALTNVEWQQRAAKTLHAADAVFQRPIGYCGHAGCAQ